MRFSLLIFFLVAASVCFSQDRYYEKQMERLKVSMNRENHKKTLAIADALLRKYPEKDGYNFPRGVAYLGLNEIREANQIADTFLKNDPNSLNGLRLKGRIFLKRGIGDSAVHYLGRATLKEVDSYHAYLLGKAQNLTGDFEHALNSFNFSLGEGDKYDAYRERGVAHIGLGDTAAAHADFDKAIEIAPSNPVNWNARGFHLWLGAERYTEALVDFDKAIKLNKNYAYAFNNRAWAKFKSGNSEGAQRDLKLSQKRLPNNPFLFRNKGLIALAEGDDKACDYLRRSIELGYTRYHGNDVRDLAQEHCPDIPTEEAPQPTIKISPKKPVRSNAPGG